MYTTLQNERIKNHSGFTLIEIALVLLVIGVAFLGIMGLGRGGQTIVTENNNTMRCDNFAMCVFVTLEAYNIEFSNSTNTWANQWAQAISDNLVIPPLLDGIAPLPYIAINKINPDNTLFFTRAIDPDLIYIDNWHPSYSLTMQPDKTTDIFNEFNMFHVKLYILPDGDTYSSKQRIYTTTLIRNGGL